MDTQKLTPARMCTACAVLPTPSDDEALCASCQRTAQIVMFAMLVLAIVLGLCTPE